MTKSADMMSQIDIEVRRLVYDRFLSHGTAISKGEVVAELSLPEAEVAASYTRLSEAHMLVLQPASGQVLMANPFSAVPTSFRVKSGAMEWWGNCIWDALGILAMIARDGTVQTWCPDCGEGLSLTVAASNVAHVECVAHFVVPSAKWWDDIVFT